MKKEFKTKEKSDYFYQVVSIIFVLAIIYTIFFASQEVFFTVGAIGGCVFLIKLALDNTFPNVF